MIDITKLAKDLDRITNDQHIIRVGNYIGEYYEDGEWKEIEGELFIKTNSDTLFRVVSNTGIVDDFDVLDTYAKVTLIDKELESSLVSRTDVDVNNKSSLRAYFPKDAIGIEMFECVQSVPPRFREDALDVFCDPEDRTMWYMSSVNKAWEYFLMDIIDDMTDEEKEQYGF